MLAAYLMIRSARAPTPRLKAGERLLGVGSVAQALGRKTASSIASEAPCPELGEGA